MSVQRAGRELLEALPDVLAAIESDDTRSEQVEARARALDEAAGYAACSLSPDSTAWKQLEDARSALRAALEAKPAAEVTDEAVRAALELVRYGMDDCDECPAHKDGSCTRDFCDESSPRYLTDKCQAALATIEARLSETERLREERDSYRDALHDWKQEYNDPAFVKVPREVLERAGAGGQAERTFAHLLLREYGMVGTGNCPSCHGSGDSGYRGGGGELEEVKRRCRTCGGTGNVADTNKPADERRYQ